MCRGLVYVLRTKKDNGFCRYHNASKRHTIVFLFRYAVVYLRFYCTLIIELTKNWHNLDQRGYDVPEEIRDKVRIYIENNGM